MPEDAPRPAQAAIRTDLGAIFVSLELSRRTWLITSLAPGAGEKMSKHAVPAGDVPALLQRFAELKRAYSDPPELYGGSRRRVFLPAWHRRTELYCRPVGVTESSAVGSGGA